MFYSTKDNQYIRYGNPFTINGVQYPQNWLNLSTPAEKTALGLEEVVATNSPENDKFYWVSSVLDKATLTYVNTPKDLDSLKLTSTSAINDIAYSILVKTDYMDSRKANDPTYEAPEAWVSWRTEIRSQAASAKTAITAATDIDELILASKVEWALDPDSTAKTGV